MIQKILVIHKTSRYQQMVLEARDEHIIELLAKRDVSVDQFERSHLAHLATIDTVRAALAARNIDHTILDRASEYDPNDWDLCITVGGDGTVLDLSHSVSTTPVLAINSDPKSSVGYFCAGDKDDFDRLLDGALDGTLDTISLSRFVIEINGTTRTPPVLNDVLITQANPAAVSRYIIDVAGHQEAQRSSGLWLSTPAGSTAAIRSAGGMVMPLGSQAYQFIVREPYSTARSHYRQLRGIHPLDTPFELVSKMDEGMIFVDGPHISYPFQIGDRIRLDASVPPLEVYGLRRQQRTS